MPSQQEVADLKARLQELLDRIVEILYHPAKSNPYTGRTDIHDKTEVSVKYRRADIDRRLAPLIEKIWQKNCETLACCQEYSPGQAYILFLSGKLGGEQFCSVLEQLKVPYTTETDNASARIGLVFNGAPLGEIKINSVKVHFPTDSIDRVTEAIH